MQDLFRNNQETAVFDETQRLAWLRLYRTENVGCVTFYQLLQRFGSAQNAIDALPELAKRGGRKKPLIAACKAEAEREYTALQKLGGQIITPMDTVYPIALTATDDTPPVLSVLGNPAILNKPCIAIVGARNASLNGKKFAAQIARDLGTRGQIIVSGLARGIDTAAHTGALNTGTIAVVAGGIDVIYPEENKGLYQSIIAANGAVIAESKLGQQPFAAAFPRRNRIVSGISRGVIVVEATLRSGSLITARLAGEQGREVYAVPGSPLDPRAGGPNHLIREGATLIRGADDVLEGLMNFAGNGMRESFARPHFLPQTDIPLDGDINEKLIEEVASHLSFSPISVDELVRVCHVTVSTLQSALLELELAGRINRLPAGRIVLAQ